MPEAWQKGIRDAAAALFENGGFMLANVVSRKKQLIPPMMQAMQS